MHDGVNFQSRSLLPAGKIALVRDGQVVWIGPLGSPIEDAEFDTVLMNPADIERLKDSVLKFNRRADIIRALLNTTA